ncbi:hypothetical protein ITX34_33555, partial [Streptomyces bryophytorum]|nr:hypothetical protein [Actinacidiphila bryophytorum]
GVVAAVLAGVPGAMPEVPLPAEVFGVAAAAPVGAGPAVLALPAVVAVLAGVPGAAAAAGRVLTGAGRPMGGGVVREGCCQVAAAAFPGSPGEPAAGWAGSAGACPHVVLADDAC